LLKADAKVFKLMGPVLVLTETPEAKANVSKRIEYIRLEITRNEGVLKDLQDKSDKKKMEIVQMQTAMQQQQQQQGQQEQQQGQQLSVA
jgi:prefoldin beta subunit